MSGRRLVPGETVYDMRAFEGFQRQGIWPREGRVLWALTERTYRVLWADGEFAVRTQLTLATLFDLLMYDLNTLLAPTPEES